MGRREGKGTHAACKIPNLGGGGSDDGQDYRGEQGEGPHDCSGRSWTRKSDGELWSNRWKSGLGALYTSETVTNALKRKPNCSLTNQN